MKTASESIDAHKRRRDFVDSSLVVSGLSLALALWLLYLNTLDLPNLAIDWDGVEAFLGNEGREPVWVPHPASGCLNPDVLLERDKEFHAFLNIFYVTSLRQFSALCQRHGRPWSPPPKPVISTAANAN